tara:strand:+ start:717 stop:1055 length:339 start_codon:yes stop_codon:yes gene_type:complete
MPDSDALPPVEEKPVLDNLGKISKMTLAVSETGQVYIFHEKPFPEPINWVEFDPEIAQMHLVSQNGRLQDLGIKVEPELNEQIKSCQKIYVVRIENGKEQEIFEMPLLIRQY